jgi:8-oxo-dGTP diphosphatase
MTSIEVAAGIILRDEQVLIAKRPNDKHKGGYWEFPGGKIEYQESPEAALFRELTEELNIVVKQSKPFSQIQFDYPEKRVLLSFFLVTEFSGEPQGLEGQEICWVAIQDLVNYQFPEANQPVVDKLIAS